MSAVWDLAVAAELCRPHVEEAARLGAGEAGAPARGALLPCLHALQHHFGYVPEPAVQLLANLLNLTRADVHGVLTFYRDFRRKPGAKKRVALCGAEACLVAGAEAVARSVRAAAAGRPADVDVETVYCLGLCSVAPAAMVDGVTLVGRLDPATAADRLIG